MHIAAVADFQGAQRKYRHTIVQAIGDNNHRGFLSEIQNESLGTLGTNAQWTFQARRATVIGGIICAAVHVLTYRQPYMEDYQSSLDK